MKTILFSRPGTCRTPGEAEQLLQAAESRGFDYALNREFAEEVRALTGRAIPDSMTYGQRTGRQPHDSVMVCYGGDGTLLEAVHRLDGEQIPVAGINSGHLGFLAAAAKEGVDTLFDAIAGGRLDVEPRHMLEACIGSTQTLHALNEVAVQHFGAAMISIAIHIDGTLAATCDGSGLIVSTPTGSTAYSLSAGGPVVAPSCRCMVVAPLAPHNLTMRPLVIPDTSVVTLEIDPRNRPMTISADNRTLEGDAPVTLEIRRSQRVVFLATPHNNSFYDTLRNKMMWGVDIRK